MTEWAQALRAQALRAQALRPYIETLNPSIADCRLPTAQKTDD